MVFFAESRKDLTDGVIGLGIFLRARNLQVTPAFVDFISPFKTDDGSTFNLNFVSNKDFPLGILMHFHGHLNGERLELLSLIVRRKPDQNQESWMDAEEKCGEFPSDFHKFFAVAGEQQIKWEASLLMVVTNPKIWKPKFSKPRLPKLIGDFTVDTGTIELENEAGKTNIKIAMKPNEKTFLLHIESSADTLLNDACFERASEQLWDKANSIFIKE